MKFVMLFALALVTSALVQSTEACNSNCTDTWLAGGKCFWILPFFYSADVSRETCRDMGGQLIQLENRAAVDYFRDYIRRSWWVDGNVIWLGMAVSGGVPATHWYDGTPVYFTNFGTWSMENECAAFNADITRQWFTTPCIPTSYKPITVCESALHAAVTAEPTATTTTPAVTAVPTTTPAVTNVLTTTPAVTTVPTTTPAVIMVPTTTPAVTTVPTTTSAVTTVPTTTPAVTTVPTTTPAVTTVPTTTPEVTTVPTTTPAVTMVPTTTPAVTTVPTTTPAVTTVPTTTPAVTTVPTTTPAVITVPTTTSAVTTVPTTTPAVTTVPTTTPAVTTVPTTTPAVTTVPTTTPAVTTVPTTTPAVTTVSTTTPAVTTVPTTTPAVTAVPTTTPAVTAVPTTIPAVTAVPTTSPAVTAVPTTTPAVTIVPTTTRAVTTVPTTTPAVTTVPTTTPVCIDGKLFNNVCYRILKCNGCVNEQAKSMCSDMGATIAPVRTKAISDFIVTYLEEIGIHSMHIDGSDAVTEGTWLYHDGTPMSYVNWRNDELTQQPDGGTAQNNLAMYPDGRMMDVSRTNRKYRVACAWE